MSTVDYNYDSTFNYGNICSLSIYSIAWTVFFFFFMDIDRTKLMSHAELGCTEFFSKSTSLLSIH